MVRTGEGGSVLSFVIVGIVLAALFIGGIYGLRQITMQPEPSEPGQETAQRGEEAAPEESEQTEQGQGEEEGARSGAQIEEEASEGTSSVPEAGAASELPQTGPAETAGSVFIVGLVSLAVVSYLRSRRLIAAFDF